MNKKIVCDEAALVAVEFDTSTILEILRRLVVNIGYEVIEAESEIASNGADVFRIQFTFLARRP